MMISLHLRIQPLTFSGVSRRNSFLSAPPSPGKRRKTLPALWHCALAASRTRLQPSSLPMSPPLCSLGMNCLRRHIPNPPLLFSSLLVSSLPDPRSALCLSHTRYLDRFSRFENLLVGRSWDFGARSQSSSGTLFFLQSIEGTRRSKAPQTGSTHSALLCARSIIFFQFFFSFFFGSIWSRSSSRFSQKNCCNTHPQRGSDGRKPHPPYHKCGNNAEERTMTTNENRKLCTASKPSYSWLLSSILLIHSSHPTSHPSSFSNHPS